MSALQFLGLMIVAISIAGAAYINRYSIGGVSADGQTAWIVDGMTGQVSICGSVAPGVAIATHGYQARTQIKELQAQLRDKPEADNSSTGTVQEDFQTQVDSAKENKKTSDAMLHPYCSLWSFEKN
jgi:hypothetical protein